MSILAQLTDLKKRIELLETGGAAGPPDTGWSVTHDTMDKVLDADLTSIDELADVVGTMIEVMIAKGLFSP